MIKLEQNTSTGGDETAGYLVELSGEYTLQKFVNEVVSNDARWGCIRASSETSFFGEHKCEYKRGKLLSNFSPEIMGKKVISANARGGWGCMDYFLQLD